VACVRYRTIPALIGAVLAATCNNMSLRARAVVPVHAPPPPNRPTREAGGQVEGQRQRPTARTRVVVCLVAAILLLVASQYLVNVSMVATEKQPTVVSAAPTSRSKGSIMKEPSRGQELIVSADTRAEAVEAQKEEKASPPNDTVPRTQQTNKQQGDRKQTSTTATAKTTPAISHGHASSSRYESTLVRG
jgi:hypothetical protein